MITRRGSCEKNILERKGKKARNIGRKRKKKGRQNRKRGRKIQKGKKKKEG